VSGLELFHFLRPWWLLGLPVVLGLRWLVHRREADSSNLPDGFPAHLSKALTMGQSEQRRFRPVDIVIAAWLLIVLAVAGPTWSKQPSPGFSETAPLVVAIEVSDSMRANDLQPTRLDRARFKVLDLIAARTGARTALIAYAGSAHVVLPPTKDAAVIKPFLESLDPLIMPEPGASAAAVLPLASRLLGDDGAIATVLFVTDGFASTDIAAFSDYASQDGMPALAALVVGTETGGLALLPDGTPVRSASGGRLDTAVDQDLISRVASAGNISVVEAAAGEGDIRALTRILESNLRQADDPNARWRDQGWWLVIIAALLVLVWFRRGWSMQW
jgi:Ca-activated chloride channel family protein